MKEHAIPQDVTGYKFHIVGNMTLGQFAQLVVGAIISFGIYSTNLYDPIKYILIFFVVILAVIAAFIPIAERPLTHWIKTFVGLLYRPTQFAWKRTPQIPDPFLYKPATATGPILPELDLSPARRQRIQEFISTTRHATTTDDEGEQVERYYEHVFSLFTTNETTLIPETAPIQVAKPSLRVRTRSLRTNPSTPLVLENALTTARPDTTKPELAPPPEVATPTPQIGVIADGSPSVTTYRSVEISQNQEYLEQQQQQKARSGAASNTTAVPEEAIPTISHQAEATAAQSANPPAGIETPMAPLSAVTRITPQQPTIPTDASGVTFNTQLPFPSKPTTPNKLVGMVLTKKNELIDGAIVEIHTNDGQVARAVRSNALGQFYVTTPLKSGVYSITVEKAGRRFEPLSITLQGKIVDPIEIHSAD